MEETEYVIVDDRWSSGPVAETFRVFRTKQKPLEYIKTPGVYSYKPFPKRLHHMSVYEMTVQLWREVLSGEELLAKVYYKVGEEFATNLPG